MTDGRNLDDTLDAFKRLLEGAFLVVSKPQEYAAAMQDVEQFLDGHQQVFTDVDGLTSAQKQQVAEIMAGLARLEMQNEARRKWVAALNESLASDGQDTP